jgi:anti-sigma regulatory factor (Ser/Thr protein kinase)
VAQVACDHVLAQRGGIDPAVATSAHTDLAGTPHAAPLGRIFLREQLRGRIPAETLRSAELLTTELVSNVVLHARTSIHLGVSRDERTLLVTVQDHEPAAPPVPDGGLEHFEESGRGMLLVATLADDFGWSRLPKDAGKVMWFTLALSPTLPDQSAEPPMEGSTSSSAM